MTVFRVAVIGGDGIGPEGIDQATRVADAALRKHGGRVEWNRLPWSGSHYLKVGWMMPPDGWEVLRRHDAILLGAIGHPQVPDPITLHGLLLPMRRKFDQYVNLRPAFLYEGVQSPLRDKPAGSIDMVVYRENTEGEYAPIGGRLSAGTPHQTPTHTTPYTPPPPAAAASGSCAPPSPLHATAAAGSPASPSPTLRRSAWSSGTTSTRPSPATTPTCSRTPCSWTRPRWTSSAARRHSMSWWP